MSTTMRLYDDGAESILKPEHYPDRLTLLPGEGGKVSGRERIRILNSAALRERAGGSRVT